MDWWRQDEENISKHVIFSPVQRERIRFSHPLFQTTIHLCIFWWQEDSSFSSPPFLNNTQCSYHVAKKWRRKQRQKVHWFSTHAHCSLVSSSSPVPCVSEWLSEWSTYSMSLLQRSARINTWMQEKAGESSSASRYLSDSVIIWILWTLKFLTPLHSSYGEWPKEDYVRVHIPCT